MNDLETLALKHDSDKSSKVTGYSAYYEKYFSPLRDKPVKLLELGVYQGNSLRLWEEYFPNGDIVGVDFRLFPGANYRFKRAKLYLGDLNNPDFVQCIAADLDLLDIIIDDAGHFPDQQRYCLYALFPRLKPKGIYVIEDLYTSYMEKFGGGYHKTGTIVDEIKTLINHMHHDYLRKNLKIEVPKLSSNEIFDDHLEAVHVYPHICFLLKR